MSNDCAPSCDLLVRREERLAKNRFHVRPGGLPVASTRGPVVHHVAEQCLCSGRPFPDVIEEYAGIGIEAARIGLGLQLTESWSITEREGGVDGKRVE